MTHQAVVEELLVEILKKIRAQGAETNAKLDALLELNRGLLEAFATYGAELGPAATPQIEDIPEAAKV